MVAVRDEQADKPFLSQSWYRVSDLRPRLRSHVQVHRHTYRDRDWYVLQDHLTGRFNRISPEAYIIVGLMDGGFTLNEIWEAACERLGDDMPTQDEVIGLLSSLHNSDAIQSDLPPDMEDLHQRNRKERRNKWLNNLRSPVALRFPLLDPDRFLERTVGIIRPLLSWPGFVLWCLAMVWAAFLLGIHWNELTLDVTDRVLGTENLLLLALTYPVVKVLHEFAHAYTVKRWGGEVHEMGIMLLVFMPIPYLDASASSAFRDKRRRMAVGAAGIMMELLLAALAVVVWSSVEPGALRAFAYNVIFIGGASTILMNGNPLIRFDAYYVLSDYLEIPNLGNRSTSYVGYLVKRHLLGSTTAKSPAHTHGEEVWFLVYAVASFVYRIFLMTAIIFFVAGKFFFIGVVLAVWTTVGMIFMPLSNMVKGVYNDPHLHKNAKKIAMAAVAAALLVFGILALVPMPRFTNYEGVIWVPEDSRVHAGANGFVTEILAASGSEVKKGDPLVILSSVETETDVEVFEARLRQIEAELRRSTVDDRTQTEILRDEMGKVDDELRRARERRAELVVRSPSDGVFLLPEEENYPGVYLSQGSPIGYVVDYSRVLVRAVVGQDSVDEVRKDTRDVEVRLSGDLDGTLPGRVLREVPAASRELPSVALSVEGGGRIALDPSSGGEAKAFERYFQFEIELPGLRLGRVGERAYVRFEHSPEPPIYRMYRSLRRTLLRRFDV